MTAPLRRHKSPRLAPMLALAGLASLMIALAVDEAAAQDLSGYPSKRVMLIVPFTAGGSNDTLARAVGQKLQEVLGQPVVIENQAGASGSLGTAQAARALPDGHVLVILSSTFTINAAVQRRQPFDPATSFAGVAMLGSAPLVLACANNVPAADAHALLALARAEPGRLNYGSAGIGSVNHMSMELLKALARLDIKHVPYRGGNQAVADLVGGHLDMFIGSTPQMLELVRAGTARGIAVTSAVRTDAAPTLPTLKEAGVAGYDLEQWWGLAAPTGTPPAVIARLNTEINRILALPDIVAFLAREGASAVPGPPELLDRHIATEFDRWRTIVAANGIRAE